MNEYQNIFFRENFYTLAWTTLQFGDTSTESTGKSNHLKSNILVSGGIRGEIRMFHPENKVSLSNQTFYVLLLGQLLYM